MSSALKELFDGNERFRTHVHSHKGKDELARLRDLAEHGQKPKYFYIGCSDSRVPQDQIMDVPFGSLFSERNIANIFVEGDPDSQAVLAYAIEELKVEHILLVGHYGCGGVADAIAERPAEEAKMLLGAQRLQDWIEPLRELYHTSDRQEIVALREEQKASDAKPPARTHPGFRALVEENVKENVKRLAESAIVAEVWKNSAGPEIHGLVYDIDSFELTDLGLSVSPTK